MYDCGQSLKEGEYAVRVFQINSMMKYTDNHALNIFKEYTPLQHRTLQTHTRLESNVTTPQEHQAQRARRGKQSEQA